MTSTDAGRPDDTRSRLLQAAEAILLQQGVHALTVRRVGQEAGLNGTLVTYHFGGVVALLSELSQRNLAPMIADWESLPTTGPGIAEIVETWLRPLLRPAAFNPAGRALVVLDEIGAHGSGDLRDDVMKAMNATGEKVRIALQPLLPDMPELVLRARLRFIAGAALGPPPRMPEAGGALSPLMTFEQLFAFALAALKD